MKYEDRSSPCSTIGQWLFENTAKLRSAEIKSARLDCMIMLESILKKERSWLIAHEDKVISKQDLAKLDAFITQREKRMPLAYILGSKEFYGREFIINKDVLIPRPESEALIDLLKKLIKKGNDINTVMDIGTGSGCLAVTVKKELPDLHVTGLDISKAALRVAAKNARLQKVQIQLKLRDIKREGLPKMPKTRPFVIMANLPYVPEKLITSPEITKEPAVALFSGEDGLDIYRILWRRLTLAQNKPLAIITESLTEQHPIMIRLAKDAGYQILKTNGLAQLWSKAEGPLLV